MNPIDDDDVDALLRQSFDGSRTDAGFCDRLMQQVPPRRRPLAWPLAAGVLLGAVMCSLSLFTSPLWRAAWHDWLAGEWSASIFIVLSTMVGLSLLSLGWALAEADDHGESSAAVG